MTVVLALQNYEMECVGGFRELGDHGHILNETNQDLFPIKLLKIYNWRGYCRYEYRTAVVHPWTSGGAQKRIGKRWTL
jgi:hypothetical protein